MHGYRRFLPLSVAIGVILLGAWLLVPRPPAPPVAGLPAGFAQHWLAGTPCRPPCWEGVTPGHTTVREALRIWGSNPGIEPGSVVTEEDRLPNWAWGYINSKWRGGQRGGSADYPLGVTDPVVNSISPDLQGSVTLQQVIDHYGQPTHIQATGGYGIEGQGPGYSLGIFYDNYGLVLSAPAEWHRKMELTPQTIFNRVSFYAPLRGLRLPVQPWRGMQSFDAYCVDGRTLKGPCPDVPLVDIGPDGLVLGLDGLLGIWLVCGVRSRQGKGPLHRPMSRLALGLLLVLCLVLGVGWYVMWTTVY